MITIVDYGVGNVQAFLNVYRRLNIPAATAKRTIQPPHTRVRRDFIALLLKTKGKFVC